MGWKGVVRSSFKDNIFAWNLSEMSESGEKAHVWQPPDRKGLGTTH